MANGTTNFSVDMDGSQAALAPYTGFTDGQLRKVLRGIQEGDGDNQVRRQLLRESTIVASGTEVFDLTTDLDHDGVALAAADIVAIGFENTSDNVTNNGSFRVEPNSTQPLTSFLDATGATDIPFIGPFKPGMGMTLWGFRDADVPVGAGATDRFLLRETGGVNTVSYKVFIWVRA